MLKREVSKKLSIRTEYHDFPSKNFLLRLPKDFRCGKLRCIRKVRLSKKFMPKRVISLFSVDFFFFTYTAYKVRYGIPLCFRIFETSKTLLLRGGHRDFPLVIFRLPVLKNFVGNPFNLTEIFGYRNFLCMRMENHVFLPKFLCLTIPKNAW